MALAMPSVALQDHSHAALQQRVCLSQDMDQATAMLWKKGKFRNMVYEHLPQVNPTISCGPCPDHGFTEYCLHSLRRGSKGKRTFSALWSPASLQNTTRNADEIVGDPHARTAMKNQPCAKTISYGTVTHNTK